MELYMIHLIAETEECGTHGKLISSWNIELIYGKLGKRSRLDCKSRRELGSTATCLQQIASLILYKILLFFCLTIKLSNWHNFLFTFLKYIKKYIKKYVKKYWQSYNKVI